MGQVLQILTELQLDLFTNRQEIFMRKIIYSVLFLLLCFSIIGCAEALNDKFPEQAVPFATESGASYTENSRKPYISSSESGTISEDCPEEIYYFECYENNSIFDISWHDSSKRIAVSVSRYQDFRSYDIGFKDDTSGSRSITVPGKIRLYIKVSSDYTYTPIQYVLKISGRVDKLNLVKVQ